MMNALLTESALMETMEFAMKENAATIPQLLNALLMEIALIVTSDLALMELASTTSVLRMEIAQMEIMEYAMTETATMTMMDAS